MDFRNKIVLAPMVRVSTLPFRLLALEYGADLVYCEEIIDHKILLCKRVKNEILNTIDFCVDGAIKPLFQTCDLEKGKLIFQIGTCNAQRALQACKIIEDDVAAIDINMGCPKEFSIQGGMGAALLKKPDLVKEIVTTLVNGCKKPITCKIRILPTIEQTIEFCKMIEACGAKAITIHGRLKDERPRQQNHNDFIREVAKHLTIPVIANGGSNLIKTYEDIIKFRDDCGVTSVMLARTAMWNCSVLRKNGGTLPIDTVIKRYLEICMTTDSFFFSTKYTVQMMLHEQLTEERGIKFLSTEIAEEVYELFNMLPDYTKWKEEHTKKLNARLIAVLSSINEAGLNGPGKNKNIDEVNDDDEGHCEKKLKVTDDSGMPIVCLPLKYVSRDYKDGSCTPKSVLNKHKVNNDLPKPIFKTEEKQPERVFRCVLEFNGVKYTTHQWEPNKQATEQAAALVCLRTLGIL